MRTHSSSTRLRTHHHQSESFIGKLCVCLCVQRFHYYTKLKITAASDGEREDDDNDGSQSICVLWYGLYSFSYSYTTPNIYDVNNVSVSLLNDNVNEAEILNDKSNQ